MKLSTKVVVLTVFSGVFALLLLVGMTQSASAASTTTAMPKAAVATQFEPPQVESPSTQFSEPLFSWYERQPVWPYRPTEAYYPNRFVGPYYGPYSPTQPGGYGIFHRYHSYFENWPPPAMGWPSSPMGW